MATVVVDIQFFKIDSRKLLPKELAVFDGQKVSHHVFRPLFPLNCLNIDLQRQAHYLMKHHHCIDWMEGSTPIFQFESIITKTTKQADRIYVKGKEKAQYIRQFVKKTVLEFGEQPSLKLGEPKCFSHSSDICMCAISNVYILYEQFIKK